MTSDKAAAGAAEIYNTNHPILDESKTQSYDQIM